MIKFNHIQGLHDIVQALLDQGRMPIPIIMQDYLGNSRAQLRIIIKELYNDKEKKPTKYLHYLTDGKEIKDIAIMTMEEVTNKNQHKDQYEWHVAEWLPVSDNCNLK